MAADTYEVFAKWAPRADLASDATFHVYHDGGVTDVVVDQTLGDGAWLSLGSFALTPGPGAKVTLGDQANGPVAADAIAAVPAAQGGSALFTWTPNLPSTGVYEVYARYVAGSERSADAAYAITHASGTANVTIDQRHNGGTWLSLGSHTFNAGTGGSVDLAAGTTGDVSADALRFVIQTGAPPPANHFYVHNDHLGTPQKMTGATAALAWDRVQTPFGMTDSETGAETLQVRFPGQWEDPETGLHYNYFRDYDPSSNRYLSSDPIGIAGGLNTYAYTLGNPLRWTDPFGLDVRICCRAAEIFFGLVDHCWISVAPTNLKWGWVATRISVRVMSTRACILLTLT